MRPEAPPPRPLPARRPAAPRRTLAALAAAAAFAAGCRQDMHDQPRFEPLEASDIFADGAASRTPVAGTVARGELRADDLFYTGLTPDGLFVQQIPLPVDAALLARGARQFDTFCSPCHDRVGGGRGMIVRRGFKQPNSFHVDRLRQAEAGYYFDVVTNGFGQMSSYAAAVAPADRWAIIAYIRALQLAQNVRLAELPAGTAAALRGEIAAAVAAERQRAARDAGGADLHAGEEEP